MKELFTCLGLVLLIRTITTFTEPVLPSTMTDQSWNDFVEEHWAEIGPHYG
jgi:hypothetical protein